MRLHLILVLILVGTAFPAKAQLTQEEERENWQAAAADIAWLLWLIGVLMTSHIPYPPIRMVSVFALNGLNVLPITDALRILISSSTLLLFIIYSFQWARNPKTT